MLPQQLPFNELAKLFPRVEFQPKGLLATEGIISIPLLDCAAPALAVQSHFFEFLELSNDSSSRSSPSVRLAHELELGAKYQILLTTAGGFYRYRLGDEVMVVGFEAQCPLLRFLGRGDLVSDLVGEKLTEPHVREVIDRALTCVGETARFALLAPADDPPARYRLYIQLCNSSSDRNRLVALELAVESGLAENPHYRYAVGLGQLAPVEVCLLDTDGPSAHEILEQLCIARGQKIGNVKPVALLAPWPVANGRFNDSKYRVVALREMFQVSKKSVECRIVGKPVEVHSLT